MEVFFPGGLFVAIHVMSMCGTIFQPNYFPQKYGKCVNEYATCVEVKVLTPRACADEIERRLKARNCSLFFK